MTRRGRSSQSVERRLDALETREDGPVGSVYYDPEAGAYRDMMHNVVARSQVGGIPLVPTDDQIERAIETGDTDCFLLPADR